MNLLDPYIYVAAIIVITGAILGLFKPGLFNRLSTRIVVLVLASGPITFILFPLSTRVLSHIGVLGAPNSFAAIGLYVLIMLGTPVTLGLLAALFVRRPLRQFNEAMTALEQSNYKVQLHSSGIHEFDEAFTKFNNLTNRLRHEEKLRKDLVSDTSHELNTPLTTMIGQLTAMQEGKYTATKARVTLIKQQAERLAELVQQLDAYTKARVPSTGVPEAINLRQLCEKLIDRFSLELRQKDIQANLHIAKDYKIYANRGAVEQIIANLIQNTLRYSKANELTIASSARVLTFSDNGQGVPSESLPYLFERFYRVDKSRSRASGGLGLGLAIVRELTESQGWTIVARAKHPGLAFDITLGA